MLKEILEGIKFGTEDVFGKKAWVIILPNTKRNQQLGTITLFDPETGETKEAFLHDVWETPKRFKNFIFSSVQKAEMAIKDNGVEDVEIIPVKVKK